MASSAQDLATVAQSFSDEAQLMQTLLAQAAGGDVNSRTMLASEIQNAAQMRGLYLASVPDADTSILDSAVHQAQAFLAGSGTASGQPFGGSINLFGLRVPVVGVALVSFLLFVAMKSRRR